jgi:hypothetical protein
MEVFLLTDSRLPEADQLLPEQSFDRIGLPRTNFERYGDSLPLAERLGVLCARNHFLTHIFNQIQ